MTLDSGDKKEVTTVAAAPTRAVSPLRQAALSAYSALISSGVQAVNDRLKECLGVDRVGGGYDTCANPDPEIGIHSGIAQRLVAQVMALNTDATTLIEHRDAIFEGALVTLRMHGGVRRYFVIRGGAGRKVDVGGTEYTAVDPASPMGEAMTGLEVWDVGFFSGREFEVVEVE